MKQRQINNILRFMHTQDRKGQWLDLMQQIEDGNADFDRELIIQTLQEWYNETQDGMYLDWISYVKKL